MSAPPPTDAAREETEADSNARADEGGDPGPCAVPRTQLVHSEYLELNADCAEFCPTPGLTHLLALGTYQLVEETQERVGRCYLRALRGPWPGCGVGPASGEGAAGGGSSVSVGASCCVDLPGIFDLKWRPAGEEAGGSGGRESRGLAVLGAALADGTVRLLEAMAVSGGGITLLSEWEAHSLEVWCTAFHRAERHLLFSGADDCYFKAYDTRSDPASPVFSDRRTHAAGVCTVSPHPGQPHLVATGSYDEHVRLWDMRNLSRPVVVSQLNTGGGNWRLRWHPHDPHVLLAACMYNGFAVLRASADWAQLDNVVAYARPNKAIAYGADWWRGPAPPPVAPAPPAAAADDAPGACTLGAGDCGRRDGDGASWLAATCSFYDRQHTLVWLPTRSA
ncbi:hypothetical protein GPECTOR_12g522 [Gonium pectorale]|uniref:methylated diphthine methylhydrolase n=1 Tax=Gonium pectorale TaxID=33097 RepID=A0A150GNZ5_GONPE|nr:hypothetical protein GPECTOR_12g522 [Gonium pectorale]|eukprot:KXZ51559.1 hypothetical protein GPECTOR_12g522 [Gonium pectorale]